MSNEVFDILEENPVIAAVQDESFNLALNSSAQIIFYLFSNLLTISERIDAAHKVGKKIFIHIDLAEGIAKDKTGVEYLKSLNVDGIISTRAQRIKCAREYSLVTVQRFFALDSQGTHSIEDMLGVTHPDFIEIMPGVIRKIIEHFSDKGVPVIAGGLIETKAEVTSALSGGALAVSTGKSDLWEI